MVQPPLALAHIEGLLFWLGPPLDLARRLWPPLLLNSLAFALMAADHLVMSFSERAAVREEQAAVASSSASLSQRPPAVEEQRSLFPPLSTSVTASLEGIFRFSLFAIALLQAHRISRV